MKKHAIAASVALRLALAAAICTLAAASALAADDAAPQGVQARLIKQGEYLSRAGDCIACHTAKGGKPYAGGLGIDSPLGVIYSTNITPDKDTGIGNYSYEDFDRALRRGVARDGHSLYPAMPYTSYAYIKPDDVKALYAYFMHGVTPVKQANRTPTSSGRCRCAGRWACGAGCSRRTPWPPRRPRLPRARRRAPTRRRCCAPYLVEGLGHCGTCHTPRGFALQEKASMPLKGRPFSRAAWSRAGWPRTCAATCATAWAAGARRTSQPS